MTHAFLLFLTQISARTAIVFLFIVVGLRVLGKREIGQMNLYDLAMIMALANAVQNAMTAGNGNLSVGFVSSGTLLVIGLIVSRIFVKLPSIEERIVGSPTLILSNGEMLTDRMKRERVTVDQLMMVIRGHELTSLDQVSMAILEVDGSISIVPKPSTAQRKPATKAPESS